MEHHIIVPNPIQERWLKNKLTQGRASKVVVRTKNLVRGSQKRILSLSINVYLVHEWVRRGVLLNPKTAWKLSRSFLEILKQIILYYVTACKSREWTWYFQRSFLLLCSFPMVSATSMLFKEVEKEYMEYIFFWIYL